MTSSLTLASSSGRPRVDGNAISPKSTGLLLLKKSRPVAPVSRSTRHGSCSLWSVHVLRPAFPRLPLPSINSMKTSALPICPQGSILSSPSSSRSSYLLSSLSAPSLASTSTLELANHRSRNTQNRQPTFAPSSTRSSLSRNSDVAYSTHQDCSAPLAPR